ncbi:ATP-binding protein [Vibrio mangrovi]|uniref:histidine kinase n=1 Tax=Vibrio mangrovi TaxID=474394 RepID=A0A1Y6IPR9_9VIBR|nr:ATP-binding protein [Vibrio mangrovi]MDW6003580.1 ATP-binding protein [Vibrio mangrovi]SMR99628.1 Signal transduction histidine-protein kinase BarA [Vibrio mangrovi]
MFSKTSYITVFIVVLLLAIFAIVEYNNYSAEQIMNETKATLVNETTYEVNKIEESIADKISLVKFLHNTPPISGITRALEHNGVDPKDSTTTEQWMNRLAVIFQALIENRREIKQLRIISVIDKGKEFLRVDRDGGKVVRIPHAFLQDKSGEAYYMAASQLAPGEIHVSPINLNIEHGKIAYPLQPTLRVITPIFFSDRERFGFLIMNIDATNILTNLTKGQGLLDEMWLVDSKGYFIHHPDSELSFSRQLNPDITLASQYQLSDIGNDGLLSAVRLIKPADELIVDRQRLYSGSSFDEHVYLYGIIHKSKIDHKIAARHYELLLLSGLTFIILTLVLGIFYRSYSTSLRLNKINSKFQSIVSSSPDAIIGADKDGRIKTWNHAASTLFDVPEHAAFNQLLDHCIRLDHQDLMASFQSVKSSNIALSLTDTRFDKKNGETKYLEITINPILDTTNKVDSYTIQVRDRTKEEEAAEMLKTSNAELEKKVQQRTEQLMQHTQQLEIAHQKAMEASHAKSNFISVISHEMRTPLNGMIGTLSLVRREPLSPDQLRYLNMAEQSTSTLSVLINDILDLSKIESGKLEISHQQFHVGRLIESLVQSSAIRAKEKGLDFILDLNYLRHGEITTDPNRLKQIINNLITNATKFTSEGEIFIRASSINPSDQPETVRLSVEVIDTGIGIARENQEKLFQPFTQEDSSTSVKYGGTGLGLSICRKLCELMDGEIGFESEQGIGSRFYFSIDMPANTCKTETKPQMLQNMMIGIYLPNKTLTSTLTETIQILGGEVYLIEDEAHISTTIEQYRLDALLLDLESPRFGPICTRLDENRQEQPLKIVALTHDSLQHWTNPTTLDITTLHSPVIIRMLAKALTNNPEFQTFSDIVTPVLTAPDSAVSLAGVRILIVEDNDINIEVAKGYLAELDVEPEVAFNGKEAIDILTQRSREGRPFHCILMDCQMPIMNGYDCARQIRFENTQTGHENTPIIAMTANAFSGEKEKCLEHGMSDYLTKPVEQSELRKKVIQWTRKYARPSLVHTEETTIHENPAEPDIEKPDVGKGGQKDNGLSPQIPVKESSYNGWDKEQALNRMGGNTALFNKVLKMYSDSVSGAMTQLAQAIEQRDASLISHQSHKLKGSYGSVGAYRLREIMADIENETMQKEIYHHEKVADYFALAISEKTLLDQEIGTYLSTLTDTPETGA